MSVKAQAAAVSYPIADGWLDRYINDNDRYFDLIEIRDGSSQYITDMIAGFTQRSQIDNNERTWRLRSTPSQEQRNANFFPTGIIFGTSTLGTEINGTLFAEASVLSWGGPTPLWDLTVGIVHPLRITRIYPRWTTARNIRIVGYSKGNY